MIRGLIFLKGSGFSFLHQIQLMKTTNFTMGGYYYLISASTKINETKKNIVAH
jgi:hypothetical protein